VRVRVRGRETERSLEEGDEDEDLEMGFDSAGPLNDARTNTVLTGRRLDGGLGLGLGLETGDWTED
jgi:hypothetical protein